MAQQNLQEQLELQRLNIQNGNHENMINIKDCIENQIVETLKNTKQIYYHKSVELNSNKENVYLLKKIHRKKGGHKASKSVNLNE